MAFQQEFPISFEEALRVTKKILSRNRELLERGVIDTESEQIVIAAYRLTQGKFLSRMELFAQLGNRIPADTAEKVVILAGSRSEGKLLQYITGTQGFLSHDYEVGPGVLVPRPETEVLLVSALSELDAVGHSPLLGLEVGSGSGVLSIELLSHFPDLRMISTEISEDAREYTRRNAARILTSATEATARLTLLTPSNPLDVLQPFQSVIQERSADFLITNPPYLAEGDSIDGDVQAHEPHSALFAPKEDPLHFYREVANSAEKWIKKDGFVFAEVPHERAELILKLFTLPKWNAKLLQDLNQRERVFVAVLKE